MRTKEVSATELVQMPAVRKSSGEVVPFPLELMKADSGMLNKMADLMGGEVVFLKMRAIYTVCETKLCAKRDCWSPVKDDSDWCSLHPSK